MAKGLQKIKIGIIGGSGFYNMPELLDSKTETITTPFGDPTDNPVSGTINGVPCVLLARHGKDHRFNPTEVNYRANIDAMRQLGVTHILSATACGSLKEELPPGHFVILDSFIDRTTKRPSTLHDQKSGSSYGTVCHIPMHPTFCNATSSVLAEAAGEVLGKLEGKNKTWSPNGTVVTIEGPRFSTKAESLLFKSWNCDVINMTTVPEVVLAKEAGISYASVAMVTDYDCWRGDEDEAVDVPKVLQQMKDNVIGVRKLFIRAIQLIGNNNWDDVIKKNQDVAKNSIVH